MAEVPNFKVVEVTLSRGTPRIVVRVEGGYRVTYHLFKDRFEVQTMEVTHPTEALTSTVLRDIVTPAKHLEAARRDLVKLKWSVLTGARKTRTKKKRGERAVATYSTDQWARFALEAVEEFKRGHGSTRRLAERWNVEERTVSDRLNQLRNKWEYVTRTEQGVRGGDLTDKAIGRLKELGLIK